MYKIDLPKRVIKQLDKIPNRDYHSISEAIQNLRETPRPTGCKKLLESFYRMRIGDFRIIYWVDDKNKSIVITNRAPCSLVLLSVNCKNKGGTRLRAKGKGIISGRYRSFLPWFAQPESPGRIDFAAIFSSPESLPSLLSTGDFSKRNR